MSACAGGLAAVVIATMLVYDHAAADELDRTYKSISGGRPYVRGPTSATFEADGHRWTIVGAEQPSGPPQPTPQRWSVETPYEVLIVREPISDEKILPFSDPVPNSVKGDTLRVTAAAGEQEPASLVLRAGAAPLENVRVTLGAFDPVEEGGPLALTTDIRVVKAWYQAGTSVSRKLDTKKTLTPELLLHDADIVRVDYRHQVNLIRDWDHLEDAPTLQPFNVPARSNQQLWLLHMLPTDARAGVYRAPLALEFRSAGRDYRVGMTVELEVLPFTLPPTSLEHALFYMGWMQEPGRDLLHTSGKTLAQVQADLAFMRAAGVTNVMLQHDYRSDASGNPRGRELGPVLRVMRELGFPNRLLYRDRHLSGSDVPEAYRAKLAKLRQIAGQYGFEQIAVYNQDEKSLKELLALHYTFDIAHDVGLQNVSTANLNDLPKLQGLLDIAIVYRKSRLSSVRASGMPVWAYHFPQAGEERPKTYRDVYGIRLWLDNFDGACNFAYQTGARPWDDWDSPNWRPHALVYPTVSGLVPTLQWEGWREGIDDLRYVGALLAQTRNVNDITQVDQRRRLLSDLVGGDLANSGRGLREQIVAALLKQQGGRRWGR